MTVKFNGILMAIPSGFECPIPDGLIAVKYPHITLLFKELTSSAKKILSEQDLDQLPDFPKISWGEPYIANNGKKISLVRDANEQDLIRLWVKLVIAILKLDIDLDASRVYHVSIANKTGSVYDSVPDPWNYKNG